MDHTCEVVLDGPFPPWGHDVLRASWGDIPAAVILGPPLVDPAALAQAQHRATPWIGRCHPGVLTLLGVQRVDDREGWIYQRPDGVVLQQLCAPPREPPVAKVALLLTAAVTSILASLPPPAHPGPTLRDVFIDAHGAITVAGFVGPQTPPPPPGEDPEAATVWSLGLLLAELLAGSPLSSGATPREHTVALRRFLIRVMSEPGPGLSEACRSCLSGMLAWEEADRPRLDALEAQLRIAAEGLRGPQLARWADQVAAALQQDTLVAPVSLDPQDDPRDYTEESEPFSIPLADDVTAVTEGGNPRHLLTPEQGAIPVGVGPPAEAVPKAPSLPADVFSSSYRGLRRRSSQIPWPVVGVTSLLLAVALGLGLYLFA
ncbi:MAG TPA: hypothetical protein ENK18_07595 [Deltaproteobacteria bacterium]|nr:hypothetical protein [Deltaproteobacteria bacterium]